MTLDELKNKLRLEIARAEAYKPAYDQDSPFSVFNTSPDYMRGGRDVLLGVLKLLDELELPKS